MSAVSFFAYVGSRTTRARNARGEGISIFALDQERGCLKLVGVESNLVNPSFLALNKNGDVLYTVHGDQEHVSAFKIDRKTGSLSFLNQQSCQGKNPVHLALDPSQRFLIVSNHLSGALAVLPIAADGSLQEVTQRLEMKGSAGPHKIEQPFSKPHFNPFDRSGKFVLVPDKGLDRVFSFRFENGHLSEAPTPCIDSREGAGPRHLAFHPLRPLVYVVNELDSTVTACKFDAESGALQPFQVLSTLPDSYTGNSRASEIEIDASGRTLYASNRGLDSVAVFSIDQDSGRLLLQQVIPSQGKTPRYFALSPNGRWMFVLNEDSDNIITFAVNTTSGELQLTDQTVFCGSPVCMVFNPSL
jgi:6-phosphogluconolactonase